MNTRSFFCIGAAEDGRAPTEEVSPKLTERGPEKGGEEIMRNIPRTFKTLLLIAFVTIGCITTALGQGSRSTLSKSALEKVEARCFNTDLKALATRFPLAAYPPEARRKNVSGKVIVKVFINELGRVYHAIVVNGPTLLRGPVLASARGVEFEPFIENEKPIKCAGLLTYTYVSQVNKSHSIARVIEEPGDHSISISRSSSNQLEENLLITAESTDAQRNKRTSCEPRSPSRTKLVGSDSWTCGFSDDTLVPFTITTDVVNYFVDHSRALRKKASFYLTRTGFTYKATIQHHGQFQMGGDEYRNVYVVSMSINWFQTCGPTPNMCSMFFEKSRTVVLNAEGLVLGIHGDGNPIVMFS